MHELGHNLGLGHGGGDEVMNKPNYLSVMNYAFQTSGLIYDNKETGTFDYSRSDQIPELDEAHLNETVGLDGGLINRVVRHPLDMPKSETQENSQR